MLDWHGSEECWEIPRGTSVNQWKYMIQEMSNTLDFHCKTSYKTMNWPKFWPIWVKMSNLIADLTATLKKDRRSTLLMIKVHLRNYVMRKKDCRSTLFMIKVHPKNCVTKKKKKRITFSMMRMYLERRVMRMKKKNNMFLVRIRENNSMMKKGQEKKLPKKQHSKLGFYP